MNGEFGSFDEEVFGNDSVKNDTEQKPSIFETFEGGFGGTPDTLGGNTTPDTTATTNAGKDSKLPTKVSVWTKIKNFLFQEVKVELTPKQQKVEDEINDFLHQDITWNKVHNFLFQEITFGKKK